VDFDLVIVGGLGHVGLPLALAFAAAGAEVGIVDPDEERARQVRLGRMPFVERGADDLLAWHSKQLHITKDPGLIARTDRVVVVVGTEVDEYLQPGLRDFDGAIAAVEQYLRRDALVALRSTVYPGTTARLARRGVRVAYCPERSVQGLALESIRGLPQIIGADDEGTALRAAALFEPLDVETVIVSAVEAELAKLYTNAWRYLHFAIGNELYEVSTRAGVDHDRVLHAVRHGYPRAADLPGPGFTAGPCLMKDTMQLAAFDGHFRLGEAARQVNEGLPDHLVRTLATDYGTLEGLRIAVLGMAFKAESDDVRDSLSFKLTRLLWFAGAEVSCTDPYATHPGLVSLEDALNGVDLVIVAVAHPEYRGLDIPLGTDVVDLWGVTRVAGAAL
jgi:UDP-N-acetyl-D-mannosaminuronic acid dehydrogenase